MSYSISGRIKGERGNPFSREPIRRLHGGTFSPILPIPERRTDFSYARAVFFLRQQRKFKPKRGGKKH